MPESRHEELFDTLVALMEEARSDQGSWYTLRAMSFALALDGFLDLVDDVSDTKIPRTEVAIKAKQVRDEFWEWCKNARENIQAAKAEGG